MIELISWNEVLVNVVSQIEIVHSSVPPRDVQSQHDAKIKQ